MSLFLKHNHQPDNNPKLLFMTPKPRDSGKQSTVSVFNNSLQHPFAPARNSGLAEGAISRDVANSSLRLSGFKFNTSTSRAESRALPGSPSSQHSSSFYDNKGTFLARVSRVYSQVCSVIHDFNLL